MNRKNSIGLITGVFGIGKVEAEKIVSKYAENDDDQISDEAGFVADIMELRKKEVVKRATEESDLIDQGYKKAERKIMDKLESELKSKFGVDDSDLKGMELVELIVSNAGKGTGAGKDMTEDQIKAHPLVVKMSTEHAKELKRKDDEHKAAMESQKSEIERVRIIERVKKTALERLESQKPILSSDTSKAAKQKANALRDLVEGFEFKEENGKIVVFKDGQPHKNTLGHLVEFEELQDEVFGSIFDFEVAESRDIPEGEDKNRQKSKKPGYKMPETADEYTEFITSEKYTDEQKIEVRDNWDKKQSGKK